MSITNNTEVNRSPQYRFKLIPLFEADVIKLEDQEYFPFKEDPHYPSKTKRYAAFPNPYIENEVKGFIQYLGVELHYCARTIVQYIDGCMRHTCLFLIKNHPDMTSIIDIPFDTLYPEYLEYLTDKGIKLSSETVHAIGGNMEIRTYPSKTQSVSGFIRFYKYIYSVAYPDNGREYDKDRWDIRKLGIPYTTMKSRERFTVNYGKIQQKWLKKAIKEYQYFRIQNRTIAAVLDGMKALNLFSEFLFQEYPQINSLLELDRSVIEDYFAYVSKRGFVPSTYNRRLSGIRTFLSVGNMLDLEDFPTKQLISNSDYRKVIHHLPKYFTEFELQQMNEHISELPTQIARMFFVLENCGMRVSDICSSKIYVDGKSCIRKTENGDYIFTYSMPKSHRNNTIPVSEIVGAVIEEAIQESQEKFGSGCIYIFAKNEAQPIGSESFSFHMNRMSLNNHLVKEDGSPLRIKGHTFRGTVATRYANCGISMDVIRMMLGQKKLGVLTHYVTIHSTTMIECMRDITEEDDRLIRSIGRAENCISEEMKEPSLLPLSNGRCAKNIETGICKHANMCYSCQMFRPIKECMPIYRQHLLESRNNISIAEMHGYERILEVNTKIVESLEKILQKLEADS